MEIEQASRWTGATGVEEFGGENELSRSNSV